MTPSFRAERSGAKNPWRFSRIIQRAYPRYITISISITFLVFLEPAMDIHPAFRPGSLAALGMTVLVRYIELIEGGMDKRTNCRPGSLAALGMTVLVR